MRNWGHFTVRGDTEFEERMSSLFSEIADRAEALVSPATCRAIVLLGGYGRGEGGVVMTGNGLQPHNNLDLLVITRGLADQAQHNLKTDLQQTILPLAEECGVEFDIATIDERRLRRSPSLVMWYDMRFGHKTLVGDADFVPSLNRFTVERIPAWDVLNLLVNRGTLLVINEQHIATRALRAEERKRVVKHAMKAIIGYGDALLYFLGQYHWSYLEKQKRMRACTTVTPAFRALYEEAVEFRFQPGYEAYERRDLPAWMGELRTALAPIHLECERKRLTRDELTWATYPEVYLRNGVWRNFGSARAWAKKALNMVRSHGTAAAGFSVPAQAGFRMLGLRGVLPALFPVVAYHIDDDNFRQFATRCLTASDASMNELRRAYLYTWATAIEPPFLELAQKWELAIEPGTTA